MHMKITSFVAYVCISRWICNIGAKLDFSIFSCSRRLEIVQIKKNMMRIKEAILRKKLIHEMNEEFKDFDFGVVNCKQTLGDK